MTVGGRAGLGGRSRPTARRSASPVVLGLARGGRGTRRARADVCRGRRGSPDRGRRRGPRRRRGRRLGRRASATVPGWSPPRRMGGGGAVATAALVRLATASTTTMTASSRTTASSTPSPDPVGLGPAPGPPGGARHSCGKGYGAGVTASGSTRRIRGPRPGTVSGMPADRSPRGGRPGAALVRRPCPRPALAPRRASAPGRSWSASSCCSRPRWRACWNRGGSWLERWPTPAALAAAPAGEAVRAWGRLGYPRRALRLHRAAEAITERHAGEVPDRARRPAGPARGRLLHRGGHRLASRTGSGTWCWTPTSAGCWPGSLPARRVPGRGDRGRDAARDRRSCPTDPPARPAGRWRRWSSGALVCTARTPSCERCPVEDRCAWRRAGRPVIRGPRRRQTYEGTDRQCRGALLAVLRVQRPAGGRASRAGRGLARRRSSGSGP